MIRSEKYCLSRHERKISTKCEAGCLQQFRHLSDFVSQPVDNHFLRPIENMRHTDDIASLYYTTTASLIHVRTNITLPGATIISCFLDRSRKNVKPSWHQ